MLKNLLNASKILGIKAFNFLFPVDFDKNYKEDNLMVATIVPTGNRFALVQRGGSVLKTYARARDARRGAERLGLTLA